MSSQEQEVKIENGNGYVVRGSLDTLPCHVMGPVVRVGVSLEDIDSQEVTKTDPSSKPDQITNLYDRLSHHAQQLIELFGPGSLRLNSAEGNGSGFPYTIFAQKKSLEARNR